MARSNLYKNYYQSFMSENMNPLYKRYLEYLMEDLPDVSDIGGYIDVPTTSEREGLESLKDTVQTPMGSMASMNQTGGGDGNQRGIGKFQNLDPRSEKMVLINGVPTKVYRNITSGLLQTYDGKNVTGDVTETGAFDYEGDAYGIPNIYSASFPPSLSSKFSLDKQRETAIQNQTVYEQKLAAEKKAKEEEARRQEEARQRAEMEKIRQQDEDRYRSQPGQYGGENRQQEREQAGPGYRGSGGADEMGSF